MNCEAWVPMKWTPPGIGTGSIAHFMPPGGLPIRTRRALSSAGACLSCRRVVHFRHLSQVVCSGDGPILRLFIGLPCPERVYYVFG